MVLVTLAEGAGICQLDKNTTPTPISATTTTPINAPCLIPILLVVCENALNQHYQA